MESVSEVPELARVQVHRMCPVAPVAHRACRGRDCAWASKMLRPEIGLFAMDLTQDEEPEKSFATLGVWLCTANPTRPIVDKDVMKWRRVYL